MNQGHTISRISRCSIFWRKSNYTARLNRDSHSIRPANITTYKNNQQLFLCSNSKSIWGNESHGICRSHKLISWYCIEFSHGTCSSYLVGVYNPSGMVKYLVATCCNHYQPFLYPSGTLYIAILVDAPHPVDCSPALSSAPK